MWTRIQRSLRNRLLTSAAWNRAARQEAERDRRGGHPVAAPRVHLDAALDWLVRAQEATPDAGVARAYGAAWSQYWQGRGWQPSYPETTGYLIPTFFDAADALGRADLRERAVRMADWEIEVQLDDGAVQGGVVGQEAKPSPAIFNTGQVILGWVRAYRETDKPTYLDAARRAGDYLVARQDEHGAFVGGHSRFASAHATTYYTRVAWPLCLLGRVCEEARYVDAGRRNLDHALTKQRENGWFAENCLDDPARPLLHTIAYAARGVLEAGLLLDEARYVDAGRRVVQGLQGALRADGGLAGRFDAAWGPAAEWSCVTGDAQVAILAAKLAAHDGEPTFAETGRRLCDFLMATQHRDHPDPGIAGGLKGSFPFDGGYCPYELLNWAAKFFVDAMLLCYPPTAAASASAD